MEILHKGEIPKSKSYIGECEYCGTILREQEGLLHQSLILLHKAECPVCRKLVQFYKEGTRDAEPVARKLARMTEED